MPGGWNHTVWLPFFECLLLVEPLDEQQVGELFHHFERVGDSSGPEVIPDRIDFGLQFTLDHSLTPQPVRTSMDTVRR